jgi:DNA mismatch repair protein MutS
LVDFERAQGASSLKDKIKGVLDLQECPKYHLDNISGSFFVKGNYPEIDALQERLARLKSFFDVLAGNIHPEHCKVESNDRDGYYITITTKRFMDIKPALRDKTFTVYEHKVAFNDIVARPVSNSSSVVKLVEAGPMKRVNSEIQVTEAELSAKVLCAYREFVSGIADEHGSLLQEVVSYICDVDWFASCAKNTVDFGYVRPSIEDRHGGRSYLEADGLRHPIIERILSATDYVPNSVSVGTEASKGILLYGINSSGKSSLSKSIGIAVIMAQAGMYVPASGFTYWPYRSLFTRIPSGDDLAKGQSTFVVEVCELRNIMKRADKNSLVIGDELASGTESVSALAIVGAGIDALYQRGASFVFATHLHDLCNISRVKRLDAITVCHLGVTYDQRLQKLIYDRKLVMGQGSTLYGLEVCKSLSLGDEFLRVANEIRQEVLDVAPNIVSRKQSVYNGNLFVDVCGVCGERAEEVHHIEPQALADENGFVGHRHKNRLSNLVPLCGSCHDKIHSGQLKVEGYVQTSDGIELTPGITTTEEKELDSIEQKIMELKGVGRTVKQISDELSVTKYKVRKTLSTI